MKFTCTGWPLGALGLALLLGCSGQPSTVTAPQVDPEQAAARALEQYDSNSNGAIDSAELETSPSLAYAMQNGADTNGDGRLTSDEIAERIRLWTSNDVNMAYVPLVLTFKGRPLSNAFVTLTPEEFLGDDFVAARGITDATGQATVLHDDDQLPSQNRGLGAIYCGLYRMKVQHQETKLPKRVTSGDGLGIEIMGDYRMTGLVYPLDRAKNSR